MIVMSSQKGFAPLLAVVFIAIIVGTISLSPSSQGVLGESEEAKKVEEQAKEESKKVEEVRKEESKKTEEVRKIEDRSRDQSKEQSREGTKRTIEKQNENSRKSGEVRKENPRFKTENTSVGIKSKTEIEGKKRETEVETPDGQKIKTKVEDDGTTKVEVEQGKLKLKYKFENGQMRLKAENERGKEVELDDNELDEMGDEAEKELEKKGIRIATGSGKPVLTKNNVAATTDFPLSVDVATNKLIVTTPAGQKTVTILPDQAIKNLLDTNIINKIDSSSGSTLTGELGQLSGVVKLEIRNDRMVYKVSGTKSHRLLGFIPVNASTTAFVSAETGETVETEQPFITSVIDFLSL